MDGIVPVRKRPPRFAAIAAKDEMELVDNEIRHGGLDCKLVVFLEVFMGHDLPKQAKTRIGSPLGRCLSSTLAVATSL